MSRHLPALKPRSILRALNKAGFFTHQVSGSHYILKHPANAALRVTVPWRNKDVKRRTPTAIMEQAGFTVEGFLDLI